MAGIPTTTLSDYTVPSAFTIPNPSTTASLAGTYVPPFAGSAITAKALSPTTTLYNNPYPTVPPFQDDTVWLNTYLAIHKLSTPSYRYTYLLWFSIAAAFSLYAIIHWSNGRRGAIGALWNKWSLRRATWRKTGSLTQPGAKHRQPIALPSNAQLLSLTIIFAITIILCFVGPDYVAPSIRVFDLSNNRTIGEEIAKGIVPLTVSTSQPRYTIDKAWWTSGGRTGTIAFALFPLCVLFALKAPPIAIFALPFTVQLYNDKLAFLHQWVGRLIWFVSTLHVVLWSVQLARDKRSNFNPSSAYTFAFDYTKFVYGWVGFIAMTLLIMLSLRPVRTDIYESFYALHVLLVPVSIVFSALHFPPIWWWCWVALILWGAERLWRLAKFVRVNGLIGGGGRRQDRYLSHTKSRPLSVFQRFNVFSQPTYGHLRGKSHMTNTTDSTNDHGTMDITDDDTRFNRRPQSADQETLKSFRSGNSAAPLMASSPGYSMTPTPIHRGFQPHSRMAGYSSRGTYLPPPGYAHATLLPGRTIRLRLIPPRHLSWAPGQFVQLTIPGISKVKTHPFTIASIYDQEAALDDGREILLLIRARNGFTRDLWNHVERLELEGKIGDKPEIDFTPPRRGVLLRAYIDGPFGSSIRAPWTSYSTVLVIAGGSGIAFGTAIMEYACLCLTGRNSKALGSKAGGIFGGSLSQIRRVRLVWIIREFSHMQWAASILRRCADMIKSNTLQIDIFVTSVPDLPKGPVEPKPGSRHLAPPNAQYMRNEEHSMNPSEVSLNSAVSSDATVGWDPRNGVPYSASNSVVARVGWDVENQNQQVNDILDMYGGLGYEEHALDLTNFDGEDDTRMPGENQLNQRLRKEGKYRRAQARKERESLPRLQIPGKDVTSQPREFLSPAYEHIGSPTPVTSRSHSPLYPPTKSPISPLSPASGVPFKEHDRSISPALESRFDMDEIEAEDMPVVAERARPGRPKMDAIIAEEARRAQGPMVVACCGPSVLNAVVRKHISKQLDPVAIYKGRAYNIDLVSEEFGW